MQHRNQMVAGHLTDVPCHHLVAVDPKSLSEPEQEYRHAGQQWEMSEGAHAMMQSTRPVTAAYGLTDSPRGWPRGSWTSCPPGATATAT